MLEWTGEARSSDRAGGGDGEMGDGEMGRRGAEGGGVRAFLVPGDWAAG